jgi:hypothetical protein
MFVAAQLLVKLEMQNKATSTSVRQDVSVGSAFAQLFVVLL